MRIGLGNVAVVATLVGDLLSRRGLKRRVKHVDVYNTCAKSVCSPMPSRESMRVHPLVFVVDPLGFSYAHMIFRSRQEAARSHMHMTPARDPKLVNVLRLEAKRSCQDLVAKIGQPALGSQDLVARSWKPQCGKHRIFGLRQ